MRRAPTRRAQGRLQVQRALLRLRAGRPGVLHRGDAPPAPAAHADRARHRRGRGAVRDFAARNPTRHRHRAALRQRPRARRCGPRTAGSSALPVVPGDPRLRPALPVHPRGRHRRLPRARGAPRPRRRLQRRRRRRARPQRGRAACSASRSRRCCRRGDRRSAAGALRRAGVRIPPEMLACCASAAAWTTASSRRPATATATRRARRSSSCASTSACGRPARRAARPYRYERELEEFLRCSPSVRPAARRRKLPPDAEPAGRARRAIAAPRPSARERLGCPRAEQRPPAYDDLERASEVIALLPSLEPRRWRGCAGTSGARRAAHRARR